MKWAIAVLAACLATVGVAGSASAAIVSYTYQGLPLSLTEAMFPPEGMPLAWPAYSGVMEIDESALPGGSLRNATVAFFDYPEVTLPPDDPAGEPKPFRQTAGLRSFSIFPFPAHIGSEITFTTDADRRITSWTSTFLDGPPDGDITSVRGDSYFLPGPRGANWLTYSAGPGSWSEPHVVPLPASWAPLAAALAGLALAGRRRPGAERPA
jgi:hypothetical protein